MHAAVSRVMGKRRPLSLLHFLQSSASASWAGQLSQGWGEGGERIMATCIQTEPR